MCLSLLPTHYVDIVVVDCDCIIRYFNEFLMAHHRHTAAELKDEYVDTMSKILFSYFKTYQSRLMKLQVNQLSMCARITAQLLLCTV